jgi:hypothetical protein
MVTVSPTTGGLTAPLATGNCTRTMVPLFALLLTSLM